MTLLSFLAVLLGFFFSALFSGVETGGYMINRIRLRHRIRKRRPAALTLARLLRNSHLFIFTLLIGNNVANYMLSREVTGLYLNRGLEEGRVLFGFLPWNAETAATLTLMFPLFIFAELGPKNLFRKKADVLMYRLAGLLRVMVILFYPLTWLLDRLFRGVTRGKRDEPGLERHRLSPDGLKEYFSVGEQDGIITSQQSRMMDNATSMHSVRIRELMTPLRQMPLLPADASVADFKRLAARRGTAFALLTEHHRVTGLISMFTVINRRLADDEAVGRYADEVMALEDKRNIKSAFYRLRRTPRHCAVIMDTHRHPIGFVRLEAIARYIAGA